VTGGGLLGWVVECWHRIFHHRVGCSVGKVVGDWAWLA
jgi:hypothetical protein